MSSNYMGSANLVLFDERNVITQSNQLVQGNLTLDSINLNRIFYSVMSCINPDVPELIDATDQEIEDYYRYTSPDSCFFKVSIKAFMQFWQLEHLSFYANVKVYCEALLNTKLDVVHMRNGVLKHRHLNVIEYAEHGEDGSGGSDFYIRLTPSAMPFMVNLHKRYLGYTKIPIRYLIDIKSVASWKLLELLLQKADIGMIVIELDALKSLLGCANKYPKFFHFNQRVLAPAKKEIEAIVGEKASVSVEPVKKGRSIVAVTFKFSFPKYVSAKKSNKLRSESIPKSRGDNSRGANEKTKTSSPVVQVVSDRAREMMEDAQNFVKQANSEK